MLSTSPAAILALATLGTAQVQFIDAAKRHLPPTSPDVRGPCAVAFGDVDGDGDTDVVLASMFTPNALWTNDGTGIFSDATDRMPNAARRSQAVALGDVDGDGDLDAVVGNAGQQDALYLNDGTGGFTEVSGRLPVDDSGTTCIVLFDADGDGDVDILLGSSPAGLQTRLYLNDGVGTFTDATAARMPGDTSATMDMVVRDFDGDGDLDIALAKDGGVRQNRLYVNDGTGVFTDQTAALLPIDSDRTTCLTASDVDGDGDFDLILGNLNAQDRLYLNDGGRFTDGTAGRLPAIAEWTAALAAGDVDGDGDADLVAGTWTFSGTSIADRLYLNDGAGTFADASAARLPASPHPTSAVAIADVDGDGDGDVLLARRQALGVWNELLLNDGTGTFANASRRAMPRGSEGTRLPVDVDGDGDLDIVVGSISGPDELYLNDGRGWFTDASARMPATTSRATALAAADVDGDGDQDVIVGGSRGEDVLYLNDGSGTFTDATLGRLPRFGSRWTADVAVCDVDADGDVDIVLGSNGVDGQTRLYLNDGTGRFTDATAARLPVESGNTRSIALGDVDGDGDPDLVVGNLNVADRLYENDGSGTFTDATGRTIGFRGGDRTHRVVLTDVDGDGDLDLVLGIFDQASDRLLLNRGDGVFDDGTAGRMPATAWVTEDLAMADVDLDGDPDLIVREQGGVGTQFYANDGTGSFTEEPARLPDAELRQPIFADLDGDGDPDLVGGSNRLLANVARHVATPHLARTGESFTIECYARYGSYRWTDVMFLFVGDTAARVPLPPHGIIGIDPSSIATLGSVVIPQPAGATIVTAAVPASSVLIGVTVHVQGLLAQLPNDLWLTNVTADVIMDL